MWQIRSLEIPTALDGCSLSRVHDSKLRPTGTFYSCKIAAWRGLTSLRKTPIRACQLRETSELVSFAEDGRTWLSFRLLWDRCALYGGKEINWQQKAYLFHRVPAFPDSPPSLTKRRPNEATLEAVNWNWKGFRLSGSGSKYQQALDTWTARVRWAWIYFRIGSQEW